MILPPDPLLDGSLLELEEPADAGGVPDLQVQPCTVLHPGQKGIHGLAGEDDAAELVGVRCCQALAEQPLALGRPCTLCCY